MPECRGLAPCSSWPQTEIAGGNTTYAFIRTPFCFWFNSPTLVNLLPPVKVVGHLANGHYCSPAAPYVGTHRYTDNPMNPFQLTYKNLLFDSPPPSPPKASPSPPTLSRDSCGSQVCRVKASRFGAPNSTPASAASQRLILLAIPLASAGVPHSSQHLLQCCVWRLMSPRLPYGRCMYSCLQCQP